MDWHVRLARADVTLGLVARREEVLARLAERICAGGARTVHDFAADVMDTLEMKRIAGAFLERAGGVDSGGGQCGCPGAWRPARGRGLRRGEADASERRRRHQHHRPVRAGDGRPGLGVLVAIASVAGFRALPGRTAYSASKAAVITFMDGLRMELAGTGVHAMPVCRLRRHPLTARVTHRMPFPAHRRPGGGRDPRRGRATPQALDLSLADACARAAPPPGAGLAAPA